MREAGIVISGFGAAVAGLLGVLGLGLTGLVWYGVALRETTSYDPSEAGVGTFGLSSAWIIGGALLLDF